MTSTWTLTAREVLSPKGSRSVLIVSPADSRRFEEAALDELEQGLAPFAGLAQTITALSPELIPPIVLLRFASTTGTPWTQCGPLAAEEQARIGQLCIRSLLAETRKLAAIGVIGLVCVEIDEDLLTMLQDGAQSQARELRMRSRSDGSIADDLEEAQRQLDAWLLKYAIFFFEQSADEVLQRHTGDMVPILERRDRVLRLLLKGAGSSGP